MKFTNEQIEKANQAKTAEELISFAKESGVELTEEKAKQFFSKLHKEGELSDDELDNVSGGCGSDPEPKYQVGQHVWIGYHTTQNYWEVVVDAPEFYDKEYGWRYLVTPVELEWQENYYLETLKYVHTTNPGPKWID